MTFALVYGITPTTKRSVIAVAVEAGRVSIVGAFYGGQDHEAALESNLDGQRHRPSDSVTRYRCISQYDARHCV